MANRIATIAIGVVSAAFVSGQSPAEFEVASVRPNKANDRIVSIDVGPGGRFACRGYTLVLLMQRAYGVMDWNVTGGPGWIRDDRFDIAARATVDGNLTEAQLRPMLQALLADRFKLRLHESTKEMSGFALVVAKGGPKVKASSSGLENSDSFRLGNTGLSGQGIPMTDFAKYVGGKIGLVVVDETGLKGLYDMKAMWTVDTDPFVPGLPGADPREGLRSAVLAALPDQLGLKIVPKKIPVRMLVIDSVEKASGN